MNYCENCKHFNDSGYKDHELTKHVGFCSRFTQTTKRREFENCTAFIDNQNNEMYFRNLKKAEQLKINLQQQINFDE